MATIRKHGNRWQCQVRSRGKYASRSFLVKADAERWGREQEIAFDRTGLTTAPLGGTLGDLVGRYLQEVTPKKKSAKNEAIELKAFLREPICAKKLSELQPQDLSNYRDQRLRKVKASTVKRSLNTIRHMLRWGHIPWDVCSVETPLQQSDRRLHPGELEALSQAARSCRNPWVLPCVLFALETGLRRGELLGATWGHLDPLLLHLSVPTSKTGHPRTVVLTEGARSLLVNRKGKDAERLFPISANALRLAWVRLCKRAGVKLRFHDLRHEAISRFFEKGLTVPEVASQSGHRTLSSLQRYAHPHVASISAKLRFAQGQQ